MAPGNQRSEPRYHPVFSPQFRRDLKALDAETHRRVLQAVEQLAANPARGKKLSGVAVGQWRVRVGDYRIRYDIEGSTVLLYRVRDRKDIYRD